MRPSIRVAAIMKLPLIYIFTHDSIAVGEDGPTHQPVEHIAALRAIPGLTVIRPADAVETARAWQWALKNNTGPVALLLSRQNLPILQNSNIDNGLDKGAYILAEGGEKPDMILIATGSEVHIALAAKDMLEDGGVTTRVVSMPSWELFDKMPQAYKDSVLSPEINVRVAVEAGISMGWEKYTGRGDAVLSMNGFGASAPGGLVLKKFGFTAENIVEKAKELLKK
jgi:transketolase